jgi:predicted TIM-barrel enzyme
MGSNATSQSSPTTGASFVKVKELIEAELAKQGVSGYKLEWY